MYLGHSVTRSVSLFLSRERMISNLLANIITTLENGRREILSGPQVTLSFVLSRVWRSQTQRAAKLRNYYISLYGEKFGAHSRRGGKNRLVHIKRRREGYNFTCTHGWDGRYKFIYTRK
jgi:hypothetical protein